MSSSYIVGIVAIGCIFGLPAIVGVVTLALKNWASVQKHREDVDLKHKLVDAGFSVEEIERVMNSGRGNSSTDTKTDDEVRLKVG